MTPIQAFRLEKQRRNRIKAFEHDFKGFCLAYFPHYFYTETCQLHDDLFQQIQEAVDNGKADAIANAAPRGYAKSTIISFALPIWCILYKKKHYILLISDTASQADDFLSNIRNELEENGLINFDFGQQIGNVWAMSNLITNNGVRIQALGAGKRVRGRRHREFRPDLIIVDDLENDENIASLEQREKLESWFNKALSKAGDERTDKFVIGTIMHYDSLLRKLIDNPTYKSKVYKAVIKWSNSPLWDQWETILTNLEDPQGVENAQKFFEEHEQEMLDGTEVLWNERESYYNLMFQRIADTESAFASEKQNEPMSAEERRFHPDWIQYYEDSDITGKNLYVVGAVDPSLGKKGGDYSAILTIGMDTNNQVYVLDADLSRRHPDIIVKDVIYKHQEFHYKKFGVEEVQFQEYFKDTLQKESEIQRANIPIRGIRTHSDKILRIESLQPDVKSGRIKFRRDQQELIQQLVNFPLASHDDGPDALELAMGMLGKKSAIGEWLKEKADELNKPSPRSILQNPNLQRIA